MHKLMIFLALAVAFLPGTASAQTANNPGTRIEIDNDVVLDADEVIGTLIVINGDVTIDGTATEAVVVINGDVDVSGAIRGRLTVVDGDISLQDGALVEDISTLRSDVTQAPGATVTGDIDEINLDAFWAVLGVFSVLLWVGLTLALLVAGIVFALIASKQLDAAAAAMTEDAAGSIVGAVVLLIAAPLLSTIAIVTIVGMPLGIGVLVFLLPALAFLGYLVAATRTGMFLLNAMKQSQSERPILAAILGILLFQLLLFVPLVGWLIVGFLSLWGAGAILAIAFRAARGKPDTTPSTPVVYD